MKSHLAAASLAIKVIQTQQQMEVMQRQHTANMRQQAAAAAAEADAAAMATQDAAAEVIQECRWGMNMSRVQNLPKGTFDT